MQQIVAAISYYLADCLISTIDEPNWQKDVFKTKESNLGQKPSSN